MWAAYKEDSFPEDGRFPPGLSPSEFQTEAVIMLREMIQGGHEIYTMMDRHGTPMGLMTVYFNDNPLQTPQFLPHANWFKWAKPRNILECVLQFTIEMKKERLGILVAEPEKWRYYDHLCKYGAIRRVGTFRGYWADGRDGIIYETVR